MNVQVDDLVRITEGKLITSDNTDKETIGKIVLRNIATDSRKTDEESMFIAFRGENVDGHKFLTSALKNAPAALIEEDFGLNSMHMVRIDGEFNLIDARSESPYRSIHVSLKTVLEQTQKAFCFENIRGTLVCVYFPDYMDGINAPGWHLHFVSEDRQKGGHVFEMSMKSGSGTLEKINSIEIKLPDEPVFDTYSLKEASGNEIKQVEQGKS